MTKPRSENAASLEMRNAAKCFIKQSNPASESRSHEHLRMHMQAPNREAPCDVKHKPKGRAFILGTVSSRGQFSGRFLSLSGGPDPACWLNCTCKPKHFSSYILDWLCPLAVQCNTKHPMYAHTSINALHFIAHANFLEPMQSSHHHVMGNLLFPPQQFMHDGLYPAQSRVLPPPGSGAGRLLACAEPIAERPLFLTHFACLSIANNDGTRSSSSLKTHVRARTWRCR
ncbi:Uncharacterized protein HZ326_10308 [Fusarium oxysporum f. sp. albedinis]|nr:Uncharacterized protein HZ326_10308 [Fusarium oxysporum f. sp. albedinis]